MKKFFAMMFCLTLALCLEASAGYSKFNSNMQRTEHFNASGKMIGYSKFNNNMARTELYDASGKMTGYSKGNSNMKRQIGRAHV